MIEVRLAIENPANWVGKVATSARVKIMGIKQRNDIVEDLVELSSEHLTPEELLSHLRKEAGIIYSDVIKVDRKRVVGMISTRDCPVCSAFFGLDAFLISANTRDDRRMEWRLFIGGDTDLKTLCQRLDSKHVKYDILEVSQRVKRREMTARQEEILRVALDLGYFDFPKRTTINELADKLHITAGTLSEILRRGVKNILLHYFEAEMHDT